MQALLAAVRTLAPGHPGELAKELMRALLWQLATTYRQSPVRSLGACYLTVMEFPGYPQAL